jgi:hypothetical protein
MWRTSWAACSAKGNWTRLGLTAKAVRARSSVRPRLISEVRVVDVVS